MAAVNSEQTLKYESRGGRTGLVFFFSGYAFCVFPEGKQTVGYRAGISLPLPALGDVAGILTCVAERVVYSHTGSGCALINGTPAGTDARYLQPGDVLRLGDGNDFCEAVVIPGMSRDMLWSSVELKDDIVALDVGRAGDLATKDPAVSRHHASFFHARKGWTLIDLGSTNGVELNGARLNRPEYLKPYDIIKLAGHVFVYTPGRLYFETDTPASAPAAAEQASAPGTHPTKSACPPKPAVSDPANNLVIDIRERNVWNRAKKLTILKDIHLEIPPGRLVLVLGGSGAGKTTFFNAVMGYEKAEGTVSYRGIDIYEEYDRMKYEIGYVPQKDLLRLSDTVYDTLSNAAQMRLPAAYTDAQYSRAVDDTLKLFGLLTEADKQAGKLSGGQRKRLSIAVEYIGSPSLFFLDEPDSGLDSTNARLLFRNLRGIADSGRTVLAISHSPDRAADYFDDIIVLAKSPSSGCGRLVFYGTVTDALRFFGTQSVEDIVELINLPSEGGKGLADRFIEQFERSRRNG